MLKTISRLSLPMLVSACATTPQVHETSYYGYGPTGPAHGQTYPLPPGLTDQRLLDPQFYMDDDATPHWLRMTEPPNR